MTPANIMMPSKEGRGDPNIHIQVTNADTVQLHVANGDRGIYIDAQDWDALDRFVRTSLEIQEKSKG